LFFGLATVYLGLQSLKEACRFNILDLFQALMNYHFHLIIFPNQRFFIVDQQFNQLEKQLISCNSKLEHEAKSNEVLKKHLDETGSFEMIKFNAFDQRNSRTAFPFQRNCRTIIHFFFCS
jgi:hypothetical protein